MRELLSIVEHYVDPFESSENAAEIPSAVRGRGDIVFGKLRDLVLALPPAQTHCNDYSWNSTIAICSRTSIAVAIRRR